MKIKTRSRSRAQLLTKTARTLIRVTKNLKSATVSALLKRNWLPWKIVDLVSENQLAALISSVAYLRRPVEPVINRKSQLNKICSTKSKRNNLRMSLLYNKMRKILKTVRFLIKSSIKSLSQIWLPIRMRKMQKSTQKLKVKQMLNWMGQTASQSVCVNAPSWRWSEQLPSGAVCTLALRETMVRLSSGIRLMTQPEKWACQRRHLMTICTCFAWDASTTSPSRRAGTIRLASCASSSIRPSKGKSSNQERKQASRSIMRIWRIWALKDWMSKIMSEKLSDSSSFLSKNFLWWWIPECQLDKKYSCRHQTRTRVT